MSEMSRWYRSYRALEFCVFEIKFLVLVLCKTFRDDNIAHFGCFLIYWRNLSHNKNISTQKMYLSKYEVDTRGRKRIFTEIYERLFHTHTQENYIIVSTESNN